ncbi:MAG: 2-oxo acid dehydrogenase subunit E2 [Chloroflexi bacterium]|nr:2-oxo acid dehydrogenase subunit E2 [Chloroflexota bacterium]
MATNIIMPALEMTQESGTLVSWLKREGETVKKGEPIMEIETDKVTIEIEASASGILGGILAREGDQVPVGQTIGWILAPGEIAPSAASVDLPSGRGHSEVKTEAPQKNVTKDATPLARKIADEHGIDLASVKSNGNKIEKADVLAHIETHQTAPKPAPVSTDISSPKKLTPASPKARQLAQQRGVDISTVTGSGPDGAVLVSDVENYKEVKSSGSLETPGTVWRVMAERMSASWTTVPHFYLMREVDASNLIEWRNKIIAIVEKRAGIKPTFTDLLVKLIGFTLRDHPRLNASWADGNIQWNKEINIGIATAIEDGLIVPVIHKADESSIGEIAVQRSDLIERARAKKLRPADISGGTFTLTNLGMYNVDAFDAIVNTPQAAILSVGRIADRVVPVNGQVMIRPMMIMTLSLDHRVVDGARAAQFLDDLASLIENPLGLLM